MGLGTRLIIFHNNIIICLIGTCNYKKSLDLDAWTYSYCNYVIKPQPFFPPEFDVAARAILRTDMSLNKEDINCANAEQVYTHLIRIME